MESGFRVAAEEFCSEVSVIQDLVSPFESTAVEPKVRAAASNSAMLLLAATFESFVRDMAGQVARAAVARAEVVAKVPNKILRDAWKRTFEAILRYRLPQNTKTLEIIDIVDEAEARAEAVFEFLRGNTNRDIYDDLVRTDVNMRAKEINRLFGMSEVPNVCSLVSQEQAVIDHFRAVPENATAADLVRFVDHFVDQRNIIAHALVSSSSIGPREVCRHIDTFRVFAQALCAVLERKFPSPREADEFASMPEP